VDGLARLECIYWDDNRAKHSSRTGYIIDTNMWYSAVATHDTETFSFYLKSENDSGFSLIQTLGAVPAALDLESVGTTLVETNNSWVVGRGLRQGIVNYFFRGEVDEIRISDRALSPSEFIIQAGPVPDIGDVVIESAGAGNVALTWATGMEYSYVLLETPSLVFPNWTTNQTGISGGYDSVTVTVPATQAATFYSVTSED